MNHAVGDKFIYFGSNSRVSRGVYILHNITCTESGDVTFFFEPVCDGEDFYTYAITKIHKLVRYDSLTDEEQFIYHLSGKVPERFYETT